MHPVTTLVCFGVRQVLGIDVQDVAAAVEQYFTDRSQALPRALATANDKAWRALGVALAGDGLLDRIQVFFASGDDKGVREQVQIFLKDNAFSFDGTPDAFRRSCLDEFKRLRKAGSLSVQDFPHSEVACQAAAFRRHTDQLGLAEEARMAVKNVADALAKGYPNLSRLIRRPTPSGPPLLAVAFCYFFRREIETDAELARGLLYDGQRQVFASQQEMLASLEQLSAAQAGAFEEVHRALDTLGGQLEGMIEQLIRIEVIAVQTHMAVLDLQAELQRVDSRHLSNFAEIRSLLEQVQQHLAQAGMQRGEVQPQHSFSIHDVNERRAVKALLARFRNLPPEEQRRVPALLNGLGKLQVGTGDFEGARKTFAEVANRVEGDVDKAEVAYNAYRVALEQRRWDDALQAVMEAAHCDPLRFEPFPLLRYRPQRILGAGGFGIVFLCEDAHFRNREVAIKVLHAADLARDLDEIFYEAHALDDLKHFAIIGVIDCAYADPGRRTRPYIVMPFFPGISLASYVEKNGPLGLNDLVAVALQVAEGIQAVHQQGFLHGDLKPENVLVCKDGDRWQVKVIDFGLVMSRQAVSNEGTILARSVTGTPMYAPPEQLGRLPGVNVGPHSDVYAFGKTCCFALFQTTEPKRRHWECLPKELVEVLENCTEQRLKDRCSDFGPVLAVLSSLDAARCGLKITSLSPGSSVPLGWLEVSGTYAVQPETSVLLFHVEGQKYYPQEMVVFRPNGTWYSKVCVGGEAGKRSTILVAAVGEMLRKEIEEVYVLEGEKTGVCMSWKGRRRVCGSRSSGPTGCLQNWP
jgi:hypothetical protein